jgi:hypothetical protein
MSRLFAHGGVIQRAPARVWRGCGAAGALRPIANQVGAPREDALAAVEHLLLASPVSDCWDRTGTSARMLFGRT